MRQVKAKDLQVGMLVKCPEDPMTDYQLSMVFDVIREKFQSGYGYGECICVCYDFDHVGYAPDDLIMVGG